MKISTNMIGNYGPQVSRNIPKQTKIQEAFDISKTSGSIDKSLVTTEEKKFFTEMYPENKTEIVNHFYSKNGKMTGVKVGSLFNKRG